VADPKEEIFPNYRSPFSFTYTHKHSIGRLNFSRRGNVIGLASVHVFVGKLDENVAPVGVIKRRTTRQCTSGHLPSSDNNLASTRIYRFYGDRAFFFSFWSQIETNVVRFSERDRLKRLVGAAGHGETARPIEGYVRSIQKSGETIGDFLRAAEPIAERRVFRRCPYNDHPTEP